MNVCESAPSVPHENPVVGVQDSDDAFAVPEQIVLATVVPSLRVQVTDCEAEPVPALATQEPVRVCGRFVPQQEVGVHAL